MTITEKILAAHAGRQSVAPGEFLEASVDLVLANDITAPLAIEEFEKAGGRALYDPTRVVLVPDHFTPCKDIRSAQQVKRVRDFAAKFSARFYEIGRAGIEHALLPEQGLIASGELIVGADSHTCTYGALGAFATGMGSTDIAAAFLLGRVWLKVPSTLRVLLSGKPPRYVGGKDVILAVISRIGVDGARYMAMEFAGDGAAHLSVEDRLTVCNMAIEAGAKNGIFEADEQAIAFQRAAGVDPGRIRVFRSDPDASYERTIEVDLSGLQPQVAAPHLPSNARDVREFSSVRIDQAVIGSCTNGRISDLRAAASVIRGRKVHPRVRCIVIPATPLIYQQALDEGLVKAFAEAGCVISPPTCGPCLGGHMGILADGETAVATTNRNFRGRMGHPGSSVYLANPAVAMASAIAGRIVHPDEVN